MARHYSPTEQLDLFWAKVTKTETCWLSSYVKDRAGYPVLSRNHVRLQASRYIWVETYGPIPKGLCVLHHCDNPGCIRPSHLFLGTKRQNTDDMLSKGRSRHLLGEDAGRAKITTDQARYIRDSTEMNTVLGKRFGLHPESVRLIKAGINWKHL